MQRLHATIEINASAEAVFDYVTHPENLPHVWPSMASVSNVERRADGSHSFDWLHKVGPLRVKGHGETERVEANRLCVVNNTGGIESTFRWTLEPNGASTRLDVDVSYAVPTPIVGRIAEGVVAKHTEHEMSDVLKKIKAALELE
jgi:carbon monoxide dehydrogenase subunit G